MPKSQDQVCNLRDNQITRKLEKKITRERISNRVIIKRISIACVLLCIVLSASVDLFQK